MPSSDDGQDEKEQDPMTVAVRDEYPVQTVPRAYYASRDDCYPSSDEEEVYDYRPRPVSQRGRFSSPSSQQRGANNNGAEKGFLVAAAMVALSLVVCCAEDG